MIKAIVASLMISVLAVLPAHSTRAAPVPWSLITAARQAPQIWLDRVINSEFSPALEPLFDVLENCPECALLLQRSDLLLADGETQGLRDAIINTVLLIEELFPNAFVLFVGEESGAAANLLEALYLAHGQRGRVDRLRLHPTSDWQNLGLNVETLLTSYGYSRRATLSGERPLVLVALPFAGAAQRLRAELLRGDRPEGSESFIGVIGDEGPQRVKPGAWQEMSAHMNNLGLLGLDDLKPLQKMTSHHWHAGFENPLFIALDGRYSESAPTRKAGRLSALVQSWQMYQVFRTITARRELNVQALERGLDLRKRWGFHAPHSRSTGFKLIARDLLDTLGEPDEDRARSRLASWTYHAQLIGKDKAKKAQLLEWQRQLNYWRTLLPVETRYGRHLREEVFDIEMAGLRPQKRLARIQQALLAHQSVDLHQRVGEAADALRMLDWALRQDIVALEDIDQLLAQAWDREGDLANLRPFDSAIGQSPLVRRVLLSRQSHITSEGWPWRAQELWSELIDQGYLPRKHSCAETLSEAQRDANE